MPALINDKSVPATRSASYTGSAALQCSAGPAVTERFDIVAAQEIITMTERDGSGSWCADNQSLNLQSERAIVGTGKDGCGATETVSLIKTP
jgi:hypothetical protein